MDSFRISVHRSSVVYEKFELDANERREWTFDLSEKQDPSAYEQQVRFRIFGPNLEYTFDRTATAEDRDEMPLPHISDVELLTNADGNTEIHVTVKNPTQHMLRQHIVVHTEETTHLSDWPSPEPNETVTSVFELNEDPTDVVRGEVRMHTGNYSDMRDSLDMVEFEAVPGDELVIEDREYEPIEPSYNYVPDDAEPEDDGTVDVPVDGADSISTDALLALAFLAAGGVAIIGLLGVGVARRL